MIVTRTPFRVTLGGGGTDLPSYYEQHGGFIFAMGIDKYMYVMLNAPIVDDKIRVHYTQSETVDHIDELRHDLVREALRKHHITKKMEVSSLADLPAGTGLGSSGCYLVGLLTALHHYRRDFVSTEILAEEACHLELDVLKKPVGKQDQYMAVFGGLTCLHIERDGRVRVQSVTLDTGILSDFLARTHVYYTGHCRDALAVLSSQSVAMTLDADNAGYKVVSESLHQIKELGYNICEILCAGDLDQFGRSLDLHWQYKKQMSNKISLTRIDEIYETVRANYHVLGGKIVGAGGGGFLMLYCEKQPQRLQDFMESLGMPRLHYGIEFEGAKVIASFSSSPAYRFHPESLLHIDRSRSVR